jgi:predicted nucleotidyltransferase
MEKRRDKLAEIARTFDLEIMYAFGSHAEDALKWLKDERSSLSILSPSDLDIAVKPSSKRKLSAKEKVQISMALEDLFSTNRVDLVSLPEADPFLAANIIRGERLFSKDTYLADEYDLYILRRAGDLIPLERERIGLIMGEEK